MMACCKNTYKKYFEVPEWDGELPKSKAVLDKAAYRLLVPDWNGKEDEVCDCICHVKGFSVRH